MHLEFFGKIDLHVSEFNFYVQPTTAIVGGQSKPFTKTQSSSFGFLSSYEIT